MRIDWSGPADEHSGNDMARRARLPPDNPDAVGNDGRKEVSGDGLPGSFLARMDSAALGKWKAAYKADYPARVDAVYRQRAIDHGDAQAERLERETVTPDIHGDVPDDPRSYSNPKTGRVDASWSTYDRAIAAARKRAGGDLGPGSLRMYDRNPETGQGTGTLIGEQTPDRLRGWRIDSQDVHVNWWDWTGGKKGAGGAYGHAWFPEDPSTLGSRHIGWAPWQDGDGNVLDGH